MRLVIQRVSESSVKVEGKLVSEIKKGLLILVGVENEDTESDIEWLAAKTANMRIFNDSAGVMNLSIQDVGGEILTISQFTLTASTKKGNRPSYIRAARPETAEPIYHKYCDLLSKMIGNEVKKGIFGADMKVSLINDGPVTIIIDSKLRE
ncbi:MAG: D-tyrosyl-tRNA(Tyr) deacylase [Muribaculaceae bacterium]|nr:D-tyrosyl-tRNA(Tyr) deacylase [Muribaculaceae bacterium]